MVKLFCLSCLFVLAHVFVVSFVYGEEIKIKRDLNSDQFFKECCNVCCGNYQAFCTGTSKLCQCEYNRTYYTNKKGKESCFLKSDILKECQYQVVNKQTLQGNFYFDITSQEGVDTELGALTFSPTSNVKKEKLHSCGFITLHFHSGPNWDVGATTDFILKKHKQHQLLYLKANPSSEYQGKLVRLTISCDGLESCVMLKFKGNMKEEIGFDQQYNGTLDNSSPRTSRRPSTTNTPDSDSKTWLIALIAGIAVLFLVTVIIIIVYCVRHNKKKGATKRADKVKYRKKTDKSKNNLISKQGEDSNRNSIHDHVSMYVSREDELERHSVYVDPNYVFDDNGKQKQKVKNPNYDYAYSQHDELPPLPTKHEYADIDPDHPYDNPESLPCPESRKSMGYAVLHGVDSNQPGSVTSTADYQALTLEDKKDNPLHQKDPNSPDSPKYFQLDHGENAL
uniref:Cnidarian restricted protein n=1 Tax=Clytia hemisphaerica TaxID=252671 RepID=A0A7M5X3F6_9CNID|eukprot:TCONS_00022580-protein